MANLACYKLRSTLLTQRTAENSIMYSSVNFNRWQCNWIHNVFPYWAKSAMEAKTQCQDSTKLVHINT